MSLTLMLSTWALGQMFVPLPIQLSPGLSAQKPFGSKPQGLSHNHYPSWPPKVSN